jgi:FSR family fosmidomycin resistance protein-like MFS transporter
MQKFGVSTQAAQVYLFVFLASNAAGVFFGGPIGDRIGRRYVIWLSILGALPFALAMPYAGLVSGTILVAIAGFIISSATAAIIVFAQELMPHRVGMISGIFFGFSFGVGGLGAAALGKVADVHGIEFVFTICSFLPAMGLIGFLLPSLPKVAKT